MGQDQLLWNEWDMELNVCHTWVNIVVDHRPELYIYIAERAILPIYRVTPLHLLFIISSFSDSLDVGHIQDETVVGIFYGYPFLPYIPLFHTSILYEVSD